MRDIITVNRLKTILSSKNYKWNPNFNIIGIRTKDQTPDKFNDFMCLVISDKLVGIWECTTEPGIYHLKNPARVNGTAILPEGQYLDTWVLGLHKGYEALVQNKPIMVYRDNNKNEFIELTGNKVGDVAGLNIHRGHESWLSNISKYLLTVIKVDKYSAACQVFAFKDNFDAFIQYCKGTGKKTFTYTLINESDFR